VPPSSSTPASAPAPGTQIAGKYRVERTLATGGMGVVVLVRHEVLGQKAVIKLLLPEVAAGPGAADRFLREARAAANLRSDHVARVFDVGELKPSRRPRPRPAWPRPNSRRAPRA
jgi:serine/threonine-protein kinase